MNFTVYQRTIFSTSAEFLRRWYTNPTSYSWYRVQRTRNSYSPSSPANSCSCQTILFSTICLARDTAICETQVAYIWIITNYYRQRDNTITSTFLRQHVIHEDSGTRAKRFFKKAEWWRQRCMKNTIDRDPLFALIILVKVDKQLSHARTKIQIF